VTFGFDTLSYFLLPQGKTVKVVKTERKTRTTDRNVFFRLSTAQRDAYLKGVPPRPINLNSTAAASAAASATAGATAAADIPSTSKRCSAKKVSLWSKMKAGASPSAASQQTPPKQAKSLWEQWTDHRIATTAPDDLPPIKPFKFSFADSDEAVATTITSAPPKPSGSTTFKFGFENQDTAPRIEAQSAAAASSSSTTPFRFNFASS